VPDKIKKEKFKKRRKCASILGQIDEDDGEIQERHLSYEYHS
jgi:hypothetical protein